MNRREALLGLLALPFVGKVAPKLKQELSLDELRLKAAEAVAKWPASKAWPNIWDSKYTHQQLLYQIAIDPYYEEANKDAITVVRMDGTVEQIKISKPDDLLYYLTDEQT